MRLGEARILGEGLELASGFDAVVDRVGDGLNDPANRSVTSRERGRERRVLADGPGLAVFPTDEAFKNAIGRFRLDLARTGQCFKGPGGLGNVKPPISP